MAPPLYSLKATGEGTLLITDGLKCRFGEQGFILFTIFEGRAPCIDLFVLFRNRRKAQTVAIAERGFRSKRLSINSLKTAVSVYFGTGGLIKRKECLINIKLCLYIRRFGNNEN